MQDQNSGFIGLVGPACVVEAEAVLEEVGRADAPAYLVRIFAVELLMVNHSPARIFVPSAATQICRASLFVPPYIAQSLVELKACPSPIGKNSS